MLKAYSWLELFSTCPTSEYVLQNVSMVIIGGLILGAAQGLGLGFWVALAGLVLMGAATIFSFITLPVEYDASNRSVGLLKTKHMVTQQEYAGAEDAFKVGCQNILSCCFRCFSKLIVLGL